MIGLLLLDRAEVKKDKLNNKIKENRENQHNTKDEENRLRKEALHDFIWAIGWASRSYKNYIQAAGGVEVLGQKVTLKNYRDLIQKNIETLLSSRERILHELRKPNEEGYLISSSNIGKIFFDGIAKGSKEEEEILDLFYRTIKETADIDYSIYRWEEIKGSKKLKMDDDEEKQLREWAMNSSQIAALLIAVTYSHLEKRGEGLSESQQNQRIRKEIYRRSDYSNHKEYPDFEKRLEKGINKVMSKLCKERLQRETVVLFKSIIGTDE